jgi:cytochrome c-type biogenesis protein CcmH/NrfG
VLVISVIFTLGAGPLQNTLATYFKVEPVGETRLLWQPTASLSWSTITDFWYRPLVGYGPAQFSYKWLQSKPVDVNNDVVWNTLFDSGVGFIPSTIVTTGLLGFLSWFTFLGLFAFLGFKALFSKFKDSFSQFLIVSSFLVSLFLWLTQIFYTPSIFSFIFTFFFTGIFLGSLFREKIIKETDFVFETSKEKSFVSIMGLILLLVAVLFWVYKIGEVVAASVYVNRAEVTLQNAQSIEAVEQSKRYLEQAVMLNASDVYLRALANISLAQVNGVLQDESTPQEELQTRFESSFSQAIEYSQLAIRVNPAGFANYIVLGSVLETVVPLGVPDSYEGAKIAYGQAQKLNPNSPLIPYLLARVEISNNNINEAKTKIAEALELKPFYFDAIVLLGRIQVSEGNTSEAIATFGVAQQIAPDNQDIRQILESLRGNAPAIIPQNIQVEPTDGDVATSTDAE